jgi:hypothetical protein
MMRVGAAMSPGGFLDIGQRFHYNARGKEEA